MRRMTVLFTGLLRHADMFVVQLEILRQLPFVADIIFSTWTDQVAAHRDLLTSLRDRYGLHVIDTHQPPIQTPGAFTHQMYALARGLRECNAGDHVLRTRTDVILDADALAHVNAKDIEIPPGRLRDLDIFRQKISVVEAEIATPFLFDDLFFYGHRADLEKLVHFDLKFDFAYDVHAPFHQKIFGTVFDRIFPGLAGYYRNDWVFSGGEGRLGWLDEDGNSYRPEFVVQALLQPAFSTICALNFLVIRDLVSVDWGEHADFFEIHGVKGSSLGRRWRGKSFDECRTLSAIYCNPGHYTARGWISCSADRFFARVVDGAFQDCPIGRSLRDAFDRLNKLDDLRDAACDIDFESFYQRNFRISAELIAARIPAFRLRAEALKAEGFEHAAQRILAGIERQKGE